MAVPAHWPPVLNERTDRVLSAVKDAVSRYSAVLETDAPIRTMTLEVKMRDDGSGVRTVLVSFQGETDPRNR
jgi:hypothetical protein